jgi:Protein of unknown function (DUF1214)
MPRASRASNAAEVQKNDDGSVDIYFGPKAPDGKDANWFPTDRQRGFELLFRLYGPNRELLKRSGRCRMLRKSRHSKLRKTMSGKRDAGRPRGYVVAQSATFAAIPGMGARPAVRAGHAGQDHGSLCGACCARRLLLGVAADQHLQVHPDREYVAHCQRRGGPTPEKPSVTLSVPDRDKISSFMRIRVADIQSCYELWKSRGAQFITEPKDKDEETLSYIGDPDGYIIEVGQSKPGFT